MRKGTRDKFSSGRVNILFGHELLVPNDLLCAIRGQHSKNAPDVFQHDKTVRNIFPEKASVFVQDYAIWNSWVFGHHGESDSAIAYVRIENSLETTLVRDLAVVHGADPLCNR